MKTSSICPLTWGRTETVERGSTFPTAVISIGTFLRTTFATSTGTGPASPPLPFLPFFPLLALVSVVLQPCVASDASNNPIKPRLVNHTLRRGDNFWFTRLNLLSIYCAGPCFTQIQVRSAEHATTSKTSINAGFQMAYEPLC